MSSSKVCHCAINFVGTPCTSGWLKAGFLFSYQKLVGTVQFSSDDMMLFLTFRPSLFAKICSCQREIQSHLTDRLWLDWIRFATFHELVERFPRWTGEISYSAAGGRIYKASLLRKVFSEAELCMRRRRAMIYIRPQRSIETIASFDQWSETIKNHQKRW